MLVFIVMCIFLNVCIMLENKTLQIEVSSVTSDLLICCTREPPRGESKY